MSLSCTPDGRALFRSMMDDASTTPLTLLQQTAAIKEAEEHAAVLQTLLGDAATVVSAFTKKIKLCEAHQELLELGTNCLLTGSMWGYYVHTQLEQGWNYDDPVETAKMMKHCLWTVAFPKQTARWKAHVVGIFSRALDKPTHELYNAFNYGQFIFNPYKKRRVT
jgi:hypothetical protein